MAAVAADHRLAGRPALEARAAVGAGAGEKVRSLAHRGVRPEAAHNDITRGAPGSAGVAVLGACVGGAVRARVRRRRQARRRPARTARSARFGLPGMAPPPHTRPEGQSSLLMHAWNSGSGQLLAHASVTTKPDASKADASKADASNEASAKADASNPAGNSMAPQHTSPPPHEAVFTHPMWNGVLHALVSVHLPRSPAKQHVWPCGQSSRVKGLQLMLPLSIPLSTTCASGATLPSGPTGPADDEPHPDTMAEATPRHIPAESISFAPFITRPASGASPRIPLILPRASPSVATCQPHETFPPAARLWPAAFFSSDRGIPWPGARRKTRALLSPLPWRTRT